MILASAGCSSNQVAERLVEGALDHRADLGGDQLVLGLGREFRVRHLDREDAGQTLAAIIARQLDLLALEDAEVVGIAGHLARQGGAQAGEMRAAIALRDVVGEAEDRLVVGIVPPHRHLDADAVALGLDIDRRRQKRGLGAVEEAHEGVEPALIHQLLAPLAAMAQIGEDDAHAGIEEGELAQAVLQRRVVELDLGEGVGRGQEGDLGAALVAASPTGVCSGASASPWVKRHLDARGRRARCCSFSLEESALTTETPTPCRPPETL